MNALAEKLYRTIYLWFKKLYWVTLRLKKMEQERIFVAGMQRSGTNMLMDILEKSFDTDVFHERDSRAFDNYKMRDQSIIRSLVEQSIAPKFVIKALCELQDLNELMAAFKPAKTIWIVRDYNDVVASMLNSFSNMEKQVIRIIKEGSDEWLGLGMTDTVRTELENFVKPGMGNASASAIQWYLRNILFFNQQFEYDKRVLLVSYEQLVNYPENEVERICKFIGIEFNSSMVRGIFSSSIHRRKPPKINPEIRLLCDQLQTDFKALLQT